MFALRRAFQRNCALATRSFAAAPEIATLPSLDYDYGELEPVISGRIMELHHSKHHQTYINNYNALMAESAKAVNDKDFNAQYDRLEKIAFNGGGHINHTLFWKNLANPNKDGGLEPDDSHPLAKAINDTFGGMEKFKEAFNAQTAAVPGSGWGWLVYDSTRDRIEIQVTRNQNTIESPRKALLAVDVWEHAYYLDYENRRPEYLKEIWRVVNWNTVCDRFDQARQ